jgi:hypothetical protein
MTWDLSYLELTYDIYMGLKSPEIACVTDHNAERQW